MYIVVVGGGRLGYYLTRDLIEKGNEVTLVDWDYNRAQLLEQELGEVVLYASGSSIDGLEKAGCERADIIVATTGDDEDNLVICQLGKRYFKVPKAIARINNPKNEVVFRELGVGTTISGTKAIADIVEAYMLKPQLINLLNYNKGESELMQLDIYPGSKAENKTIEELDIPKECKIQIIIRGNEFIYPQLSTELINGDIAIISKPRTSSEEVLSFLYGLVG